MGLTISSLFTSFFRKKQMDFLIAGLNSAGKTTILKKLKLKINVREKPTVGYNIETVEYDNTRFTVWNVEGRNKVRPLWEFIFQDTRAVVFVVDSTDRERIAEAGKELAMIFNEYTLRDAILLIFANKQDLPKAMSAPELTNKLGLNNLRGRRWYIQFTCATRGHELYEGLDWLSNEVTKLE